MAVISSVFYFILIFLNIQCEGRKSKLLEDAKLNFTQLGHKYGMSIEEHEVITEDGFILTIFHLASEIRKDIPVLLQHGILDSADSFILRGNTSLAVTLSRAGYDVWVSNTRGNKYGRRHLKLDPDNDKAFWNYSLQENGYYDAAAIVDFVLNKTGKKTLNVIGHSQGNTIFFILGAMRPEYNKRINLLVAVAPVAFLNHIRPPLSGLIELILILDKILPTSISPEVLAESSFYKPILREICSQKQLNYEICAYGFFFILTGADAEQFERDFLPVAIGHFPQSASRKSLVHWAQIMHGKNFSQYDYGENGNLQIYKTSNPPNYNLKQVTMKTAIYASKNDNLSPLDDVQLLTQRLPNVVEYTVMKYPKWNHLDWMWGLYMQIYFFPRLLRLLSKYS